MKKMIYTLLFVLLLGTCMSACGGKAPAAEKDEYETADNPESSAEDADSGQAADTEDARWHNAVDWTQYPENQTDLVFLSEVKAPFTLEDLTPFITDFDMEGKDADGNRIEMKPSDLTGDYVAEEGLIDLNDEFFKLYLYNENEEPMHALQDHFALTCDSSTDPALFGITDVDMPDDREAYENDTLKLQETAKKYGRPSYVVQTKGHEHEWVELYWQKKGYRFGYLLYDFSEGGTPMPHLAAIQFYTDDIWDSYTKMNSYFAKEKYIVPFDEYIGNSTVSADAQTEEKDPVSNVSVPDVEKEQADEKYDFLHYQDEHVRAEYDGHDKSYRLTEILDKETGSFEVPSYINDVPVVKISIKSDASNVSALHSLVIPETVKELYSVGSSPSLDSVTLAEGCRLDLVDGALYQYCEEVYAENGKDKIRVDSIAYPSAKELWGPIRLPSLTVSNAGHDGEPLFAVYFGEYEKLPEKEDLFYYDTATEEYPDMDSYRKNVIFYVPPSQAELKNMLESYGMQVKDAG